MAFTMTFAALGLLLILGIPISISLLLSGTLGYMLAIGFQPGITALAQGAYSDLNSFVIIAIPLYILMGQLMLKGGAGRDLFDLAQRFLGKLPEVLPSPLSPRAPSSPPFPDRPQPLQRP